MVDPYFVSGELKIWSTRTNNISMLLSGHKDSINTVRYSPNGQLIATASKDKTVKLWDTQSGKEVGLYQSNASIELLAFSPNGKQLVIGGSDGKIYLLSIE